MGNLEFISKEEFITKFHQLIDSISEDEEKLQYYFSLFSSLEQLNTEEHLLNETARYKNALVHILELISKNSIRDNCFKNEYNTIGGMIVLLGNVRFEANYGLYGEDYLLSRK